MQKNTIKSLNLLNLVREKNLRFSEIFIYSVRSVNYKSELKLYHLKEGRRINNDLFFYLEIYRTLQKINFYMAKHRTQ